MTSTARLNAQPEAADDEPLVRRDMTGNVVAIVADADLLIASRIMAARRVRHLPLSRTGRITGRHGHTTLPATSPPGARRAASCSIPAFRRFRCRAHLRTTPGFTRSS